MGIVVKNLPKDLDNLDPEGGDVVVDNDGDTWLVTEDLMAVNLGYGNVVQLDEIRVVKVFSNCTLTLA